MTALVVKAPAGLGKTSLVIEKIKTSSHKRIEIYVPTLALAREIHAKLVTLGETALVILGREQESEPGQTMCQKHVLAGAIARIGYHVFPVICMGAQTPGDKFSFKRCEYFDDCSYLGQFESDARVLIYTHAYLPLPRNSKENTHPSLVIVDESFLSTCLLNYQCPRGRLEKKADEDVVIACVLSKVFSAVDERKPLLAELRSAGLTAEILQEVRDDISMGMSFNPFNSDEEALKNLPGEPRVRLDLLMEILEAELPTGRDESHGVSYDYEKKALKLHYRKPITRFRAAPDEPPIIVIDANADPELIRAWFRELTFKDIPVSRNAYVVQCHSSRGATASFAAWENAGPNPKERAAKNVAGLNELIRYESAGGKTKVLVAGPQKITGNPKKGIVPLVSCPPNGALAHFGALRGVDVYKEFDTVIIVGRNQPPIAELEDLARAFWFDSETPLGFAEEFVAERRPYRFKDPGKSMEIEVPVHPDPRVQRLQEQIREGESTQAIDRLRLIHAAVPKRVIVVSNIPLGLEIDELVDLKSLLYRTRLDRAWEQLRGVLPLNPAWLSKRFPDLWPTKDAARTDLRAGRKSGHFSNSIFIRSLTTLSYEYGVGAQKRRSHALSILPVHETKDALVRLLGVPLVVREGIGQKQNPDFHATYGAPKLEPMQAHGTATGG